MKKAVILVVLLLTLIPPVAYAQSVCASLFTQARTPPSQSELSNNLAQESQHFISKFRNYKEVREHNELYIPGREQENADLPFLRFREAHRHYENHLTPLWERILDLKENETAPLSQEQLHQNNRSLQTSTDAFFREINGYILRASEFFRSIGIHHSIVFRNEIEHNKATSLYIVISPKGTHPLNRLAKNLFEDRISRGKVAPGYRVIIDFDPVQLIESNSSGFFVKDADGNRHIVLHPYMIAEDSIYRNSTGLHEFSHVINDWLSDLGYIKPYHAEITPLKLSHETKEKIAGYDKYFNLDEVVAYRFTIRTLIHQALLKPYEPGLYEDAFESIIKASQRIVDFSEVTNSIFKVIDSREPTRHYSMDIRDVKVDVGADRFHVFSSGELNPKDVIAMTDFTISLYKTITEKLIESQKKNSSKQKEVLKKVGRILSLYEVRKLENRNYPSKEQIESLL